MSNDELVVTTEMRRAVLAEQCTIQGHNFLTVVDAAGDPKSVWCERCPKKWRVVDGDGT